VIPVKADALDTAVATGRRYRNLFGAVSLFSVLAGLLLLLTTFASLGDDMPLILDAAKKGPTFLYIEVDNLDFILSALKNSKIVQPERTAFYGMREVGFQDPAGHYLTFAQAVAK